jgi:hypothetical protein
MSIPCTCLFVVLLRKSGNFTLHFMVLFKQVPFVRIPLYIVSNNTGNLVNCWHFVIQSYFTCTVPLEDKLKPDHEVRYPEEEGLYVGSRLTVTNRNRNKLERRLLASGDR